MSRAIDLLGLPSLLALAVEEDHDHCRVTVANRMEPTACPACQSGLYKHGSKPQVFIDTPLRGKPTSIQLERRRYRCKACDKTFFEPLAGIDESRMMTERAVKYARDNSIRETFRKVADQLGVDPMTVRRIFDDFSATFQTKGRFQTPEILGIDELKIVGDYRCMLTNVQKLTVFDLLQTRKKADLLSYFRGLPDRHRVKVITMDMWSVYRQVAQAVFPGCPIVADRFHVVRMANDALERVRKRVRRELDLKARLKLKNERFILLKRARDLSEGDLAKLAAWSEQFPALGAAHTAKEAFFDIYAHTDKQLAQASARQWLHTVPSLVAKEFRETTVALQSWWDEIFAWYDYPISNAYTESINRFAKDLNRMGRGYSFEVVRARLLLDSEARRPTTRRIRARVSANSDRMLYDSLSFMGMGRMGPACLDQTEIVEKVVEYGPHIPTLCELLEADHFE